MTPESVTEGNKKQKEFYETKKINFPTKVWFYLRNGILNKIRKQTGVEKEIYDLHVSWLGNISKKKVLDLGCYEGNSLSYYLASNSGEYLGIDLSEKGIKVLNNRLKGIPNATALSCDFLSESFNEKDFDIIYAYGVLHHFKNTDELIIRLKGKLASKGLIISYDPLKTSFPVKIIRALYRPFQSDKDWEWPFSKRTYYKYQEAFKIVEQRAVLGKGKWYFLIDFLPISEETKTKIGTRWHREDWERSKESTSYMFDCMHLTMLMQKKD